MNAEACLSSKYSLFTGSFRHAGHTAENRLAHSSLHRGILGQCVAALVVGVAGMTLHLDKGHVVLLGELKQSFPKVPVFNRSFVGVDPAVPAPLLQPLLVECVDEVICVTVHCYISGLFDGAQTADGSHELHSIVRSLVFAASDLAFVETFRDMPELPRTNEDVVNYFLRVFGDRIAFTERGRKTACKCSVRPDGLWYYLYCMATKLYEIYQAHNPDVEAAFVEATGIESAMCEKKLSHKDNRIMNLRNDSYEGKDIFVEPHVKLHPARSGADHQRIYYCFDYELGLIIIGWVGDHLRTAGTMHLC